MNEWSILAEEFGKLKLIVLVCNDTDGHRLWAGYSDYESTGFSRFSALASRAGALLGNIAVDQYTSERWYEHLFENCREFVTEPHPGRLVGYKDDGKDGLSVYSRQEIRDAGSVSRLAATAILSSQSESSAAAGTAVLEKLNEVSAAIVSLTAQPVVESPAVRPYMKKSDAERIAGEKFGTLWNIDNQSEWARQIECGRDMVPKLKAWNDADRKRKGLARISAKLHGRVDPAILEAIKAGDKSILGSLTDKTRDWFDSLGDEDRQEALDLLSDAYREAE